MTAENKGFDSIVRATAILSTSSAAAIVLGLIRSKVNAVFLEPMGFGHLALLQTIVTFAVLIAGLGVGSGLVKLGAGQAAGRDPAGVAAFWEAARWILGSAMAGSAILLIVFRKTLSLWFLGSSVYTSSVTLMGIAVVFTLAGALNTSILNAYHRVGALAKNAVIVSLLGTICGIVLIAIWRSKGIVPFVIAASLITWWVSWYQRRCEIGEIPAHSKRSEILRAARSLLRFGIPFTASNMAGTAVQMVLPILVLHMLGTESVGYYRAATSISVSYLGFLITSMSQDYFPRVSAVSDRQALNDVVNKQQRLVLILGVPMILGTLCAVPFLVPLAYSLKFSPTVEILEWQLVGDLLKFSSWTMSFAILARCSSSTYFCVELAGGATFLLSTWLGVRWFGLAGLGISFLVSYAVYYAVVHAVVHRRLGVRSTSMNSAILAASLCAGILLRILSHPPLSAYRTPAGLVLVFAAASWSLLTLAREVENFGKMAPLLSAVVRARDYVKTWMPQA